MKLPFIKNISVIFLFVIYVCTASCKKELDQGPVGATNSQEFWTSQYAVDQATAAMYAQLRSALRDAPDYNQSEPSFFIFGDLVSGLFNCASGDTFLPYGLTATGSIPWNFSYVPYGAEALENWSRFYQIVALSTLIIENVKTMPTSLFKSEAVKEQYIAQALFMRAYVYFYMTRVWGDPVYVARTYNDVDYGHIPPLARMPENQVLDSCLRDLKIADGSLDYAGGDPTKSITANKGSVEALMAHIYEWMHNYDSAHYYCQQVITNGGYSLEPMATYTNIWKGQSSNESIFEIAMQYNSNDPNFKGGGTNAEANFNTFGGFLKGSIVSQERTSCWIAPAGGIIDQLLFDTANDKRAKSILSFQQATGGDVKGYMLMKYTNFAYQSPTTKQYPFINNNLVIFRLSDMYLLDAEALAYKNDLAGAKDDLAKTEDRAGINNYQSINNQYNLVDEVVMERGREFIGEGSWFYDLIRTEQTQGWLEYIGYPATRVNPQNKGYYWPLDMSTLFPYDNLLVQNPYWQNNAAR